MEGFSLELNINDKLFLRNPQHSEIGRRILKNSILLFDEIGLEQFTFKKLAEQVGSTEATMYRYFENKNYLLLYLINWYWEWMKIHIDYAIHNVEDPRLRLKKAINAIVDTAKRNTNVDFIDEDILHRIVIVEGTKAYHSKDVDQLNKDGFFTSYKTLCQKLAGVILEVNPNYPYPRALATNLLEMANDNIYFAEHLPRLTDIKKGENIFDQITEMLQFFAFRLLSSAHITSTQIKHV
jgi:AcrR family transcriptional regulator